MRPGQEEAEDQKEDQEAHVGQVDASEENPISELQELCQRQQISMPRYEFEVISEGFRCSVRAMGLEGVGEGRSKKQAKVRAARELLKGVGGHS
ncbi:putative dsRNA-binding protein [Acaryochloris sp. 'Moss Beach']|uniref:putative dsRNA-binding protein n=1 Tax=Acaryochloris sp. 'Moss Beach' TaxID=2740837 RepID=UPI0028F4398D|nr:putative dsRNA-binding protein [Acaryochloris sp. 'Moss Beach']